MIGIYKLTSPTGRIYIGESVDIERRWKEHSKGKSGCPKLQDSINKHGFKNFKREILEECEITQLKIRERFYQELYNAISDFNLNSQLTSTLELKQVHSEETKRKISIAGRGKVISEEHRLKLSKFHTGKILSQETRSKMRKPKSKESCKNMNKDKVGKTTSEETKTKIRLGNLGKVISRETRKQISDTLKKNGTKLGGRNPSAKKVINIITKEEFETIKQGADSIGIKPDKLQYKLRGKNDTVFMFYSDYLKSLTNGK